MNNNTNIICDTYTLFKFIQLISNYEEGLIDKIKLFLKPNAQQYFFSLNETVKKIMYTVSDHDNCYQYDKFLKGKYKHIYCPCYFNRKHKIFTNLKKRKLSTIVTIKSLEYNADTFEKEYKIGYYVNNVFYYEQICKEDELEKLNQTD